ncbi:DUF1449 family protein [Sinimarinibacterium sp. CAU 1509]|uniref:OB-fold-containig protein n=1 Tax=Sinimarinibacterium sp. CAU 1509 TaxID=2562283 RepID=UPI0010AD5768|nr:OB-fold-containig protein [Sinimarinibacterium sp. CAU 1509]TJY57327.1 DUF1449 family protein [Sinimarinibacterium sp. CAU 1509]
MDLLAFLTSDGNLPFLVSSVFLVMLLVLEIIGVLFAGFGLSSIGEAFGMDHDIDVDGGAGVGGLAADALGYMHWGRVPLIVLLASLTGLFALAGYGVQSISQSLLGFQLPSWLASIPALVGGVVGTHYVAKPIARLMPRDTGDAVRDRDLFGLVGRVKLGPVRHDRPGEALVRDIKGREHFIRITAPHAGAVLPLDAEIVVTGRAGPFYVAQLASAPELSGSSFSPVQEAPQVGAEQGAVDNLHKEK